jgi:MFS family permease
MTSERQIQRVYFLAVFLFWLATALPLPILVLILQSRGLDLFQIGILMGAYSLTIVLLEVPTGGLADSVGRKRVSMVAYSTTMIAGLILLFSFSFSLFLVGWILAGVGRALASGSLDAWFVDALREANPEIDLQPPLAKAGTVTFLALGLGTLLSGILPRLFGSLPAEGSAVLTPFTMTVVLSSVILIILLIVIGLFVHDSRSATMKGAWKRGFQEVPIIVRDAFNLSKNNTTLLLLLGITLTSGLALASIETFWSPYFASLLGGSDGRSLFFGAVMAGSFIAGMVGNLSSIPLSRLLKGRYGLVAAVFQGLQGFLLVLLAIQGAVIPAVMMFWLVYLSRGVIDSPHAALVNEEIPADRRSSMLSVQSLAAYVGSFLGSVLLGYVAKTSSLGAAWTIAGSLLLVSLVLYLRVDSRRTQLQKGSHEPETALL